MPVESGHLAAYAEYECEAAHQGFGGRDSEHCASKRGPALEPSGAIPSAPVGSGQRPPPRLREELGSSLEASVLARVRSIFYSYPPETIARWCGITVASARLYKSGRRKPSRTVLRLLTLHREERVLGAEWRGFRVVGNTIVDPQGSGVTPAQLEGYIIVMQFAAEMAKRNPEDRAQFYALLRSIG